MVSLRVWLDESLVQAVEDKEVVGRNVVDDGAEDEEEVQRMYS